jgi:alkylation response protein AidB-like acyl-CoA dehydrogenase
MTDRIQFGKPIGSFQATQHKAADMFIRKELSKSAVYYATGAMVEGVKDKALAVSTAKATCSAAYADIAKAAVQLHGAYGFTNESDIGLFVKRAKVTEILFGNTDYHIDRYAKLKDY